MRCYFCHHTDPAALEMRDTEAHGRIALCCDERACLRRMRPLFARAAAELDR